MEYQQQDLEASPAAARSYEFAFLILDESQWDGLAQALAKHQITGYSAPVLKRIQLAYPINKVTAAVFGFVHFSANPQSVKELEHNLRTQAGLLRSMIMVATPASKQSAGRAASPEEMKASPDQIAPHKEQSGTEPAPAALTNEDLEKTIEKMLQSQ